MNEWSIQQLARLAGTTSRTLRHYGEIGLLAPSRIGSNGYRYYDSAALRRHLDELRRDQRRVERRIASVASTITALEKGETPMTEQMFDGFDHTQYKHEVIERWGTQAYADSDRWWRGMDAAGRADAKAQVAGLSAAWADAAERGVDPASDEAQGLAARHVAWLRGIPGTPAARPDGDIAGYVRGLGEMYVTDSRFGANYGGGAGAAFVRDALAVYADAQL